MRVLVRQTEAWLGPWGIFYSRYLVGVETPGGRYVGYWRPMRKRCRRGPAIRLRDWVWCPVLIAAAMLWPLLR
jgi:hypothetical protein